MDIESSTMLEKVTQFKVIMRNNVPALLNIQKIKIFNRTGYTIEVKRQRITHRDANNMSQLFQ